MVLPPNKNLEEQARRYWEMEKSILYFVAQIWGLVPQPIRPEYQARWDIGLLLTGEDWDNFSHTVTKNWFESYVDGLHLTWQQSLVMYGIDKALRGECSLRISIVSGHGIGKSCLSAIIILWFLFIHPDCQIACTSPGQQQLYDILWKELKKWIEKMPPQIGNLFLWESSHIRMKEAPETWFARAKTASKESTEALAGVHADHILLICDEASGIEEAIYETMEGSLTSGHTIVFLIGNGTRSTGYFYDTHHKDKARWQTYSFSSLDSPRVDQKFVDGIIAKYGSDSVQYAIRVEGKFPDEGVMDSGGYVQLFNEKDLHWVRFDPNWNPVGRITCGLDPSGEGDDQTEWAVKDRQRIGIIAEESKSTPAGIAIKSVTICDKFRIHANDLIIDSFGVGSDVAMEIALATSQQKNKSPWRTHPVNVGESCEDESDKLQFVNLRAKMYYEFMKWCRAGGEIMESERFKDELLSIRFKRTTTGRIQIMDKVTMKKQGFASPNKADAAALNFLIPNYNIIRTPENNQNQEDFDQFATVG